MLVLDFLENDDVIVQQKGKQKNTVCAHGRIWQLPAAVHAELFIYLLSCLISLSCCTFFNSELQAKKGCTKVTVAHANKIKRATYPTFFFFFFAVGAVIMYVSPL